MFALAFIPLINAAALKSGKRFPWIPDPLQLIPEKIRAFIPKGPPTILASQKSIFAALASTDDPNLVKTKLLAMLKKTPGNLSHEVLATVNEIQRCQKNHLVQIGLVPTGPHIHAKLCDQLLSFKFWGAFQAKLGLFGTFLGVSAGLTIMAVGLKDIQKSPQESGMVTTTQVAEQDASKRGVAIIQDVIASCATAFDTSVVGLFFAILFSYLDRKYSDRILRLVAPIATQLDHFSADWALSETDSLDQSLIKLHNIVDSLRDAATENARSSLMLINGLMTHLDSAFDRFGREMTQAVQQGMDARYTEHLNSVAIVQSSVADLITTLKEMRHKAVSSNITPLEIESVTSKAA